MFQLRIDREKAEIVFFSEPSLKVVGAIENLGLRQQSQMMWNIHSPAPWILDKLKNFARKFSSVGAEIVYEDIQVDTQPPVLATSEAMSEIEDLKREVAELKKLLGVCSQKLSDLKATPKAKKSRSKASRRNGS